MSAQPPGVAGADPFAADGRGERGRIGVLLSHGFTGSPVSMRPWADRLAADGYTVRLPLLPGHGTSWQDLNRTKWTDWYIEVRQAYAELTERCDLVFVCGLSLGGALVLRLAEDSADDGKLAGVVVVNPAIGTNRRDVALAKYIAPFVPSRPALGNDIKKPGVDEYCYDRTPLRALVSMLELWQLTAANLGLITAPVLFFHSTEDHIVDEKSGELLSAGATATTVTEVPLPNSYHVATLDNDAELIFERTAEFIASQVGAGQP